MAISNAANLVNKRNLATVSNDRSNPIQHVPISYLWALRVILGIQFLSAWARRYVNVPSKMDFNSPGNVGQKFSQFMPHAIWPVKPIIHAIIIHPPIAAGFLILFSWIEFLVGLFLITGTLTRLAALGASLLSLLILLGAGWLGTSCVDEWQIGSVEGAASMIFIFVGAGKQGIDNFIRSKWDGQIKIGKWRIPLL